MNLFFSSLQNQIILMQQSLSLAYYLSIYEDTDTKVRKNLRWKPEEMVTPTHLENGPGTECFRLYI